MKIAMLGHKRVPSREGGVEIVVEQLATHMVEKGHDVCIYNRYKGEKKIKEYKGVHVYEVGTPKSNALSVPVYSFKAAVRAACGKYDVIHFHAEGSCAMIPLARMLGKRCIATIHGLDWQRAKWGGFAKKYLLFGEKMAAKYADEVIVLSCNMREYFKNTYGRDTNLIPNGIVPTMRQSPKIITEKYGLVGRDYVLFLARLTPEKGLHYLIDAFKKLNTDKKLIIAGRDDPETDYIKQVKAMAADDSRIIFTGLVQGDLLVELFSNCYVYCLPSDLEGMPISLLEAVSFRARCLISDIPENTEPVGEYAHTFRHGNTDDLYNKLAELINSQDLYDSNFRSDVSPSDVEQQLDAFVHTYDWNTVTDATLRLYSKSHNK